MFDRSKRFIKYRVCPLFLCVVLFSFTIPFASASDFTGTGRVVFEQNRWNSSNGPFIFYYNATETRSLPFENVVISGRSDDNGIDYGSYILSNVSIPDTVFTSTVSIYFSCFTAFNINESHYRKPWIFNDTVPDFTLGYTDPDTGVVSTSNQVGVSTFTPVSPQDASNVGILLDARINPSSLAPAKDIFITSTAPLYAWDSTSGYTLAPFIQVVSFRVVSTESSAELDGLESIADQIVAQSNMMSAFYGDIVAICNQIYSRLGDMQATAELANVYFQQMITLLQHIDTVTTNIYNLLPTQFALLETAINTASVDIAAAIAAQTDALITYFDSVFSGAVGDLPEQSEDLESQIGNVGTAENEYQSNASATFEQLSAEFTGFTGGTLSGIALASNLFTQVWNALGEYSVVYSFPLLFGLCLLLIGRLSRHSGGQSSTDKERGDSDA